MLSRPTDDFQLNWQTCLEEDIVPPAEREKQEKADREKLEKERLAAETKDKREGKRKYAEIYEEFCRGWSLPKKRFIQRTNWRRLSSDNFCKKPSRCVFSV